MNHLLERREKAGATGQKRANNYCKSASIAVFYAAASGKRGGSFLSLEHFQQKCEAVLRRIMHKKRDRAVLRIRFNWNRSIFRLSDPEGQFCTLK
jgi:hypothetical protein